MACADPKASCQLIESKCATNFFARCDYHGRTLYEDKKLFALLVAALTLAMVAACASEADLGNAPGRGVYIPESWQTTRTVDGHYHHVIQKKIACSKCHELTDTAIGPVVPSRCANCHEQEAKLEHAPAEARAKFGPNATTDCTDCHTFAVDLPQDAAHQGPVKTHPPSDCSRCHLVQQGDTPAVQVHNTEKCLSCHQPHQQQTPTSAPCDECHKDVSTTHAATDKSNVEICTTCHTHQHAPASDARGTCAGCHANDTSVPKRALIGDTALFEGHSDCVGCHRPHDFEKSEAVNCRSCHEDMLVLGGHRVKAHNNCTNCHDPHNVKSASATACSWCHRDVSPNHPKHGKAGTCTGCHDPHPSSAHALDKVRNCSSCHHQGANDKDLHDGVSCRECHRPHNFLLASQGVQLCARCHADNTAHATSLPGHATCSNCHRGLPHRPAALQVACQTCHKQEHEEANPGHAECQNCHEPHAGTLQKDCKSCHQNEHRTAPKGHQECTQCHQPHSGLPNNAACSSCHAQVATSPHGKLSANCADCHRPHGPDGIARPPPCGSCHQPATLVGLHATAQHGKCSNCHTQHGENQPERERCLTCHKDRQDHFPNAPACASCHLFVKSNK